MPKKEDKELSFEESLTKLEEIVKKLESGEVPLDEAIEKYTEAMKLSNSCDEKLKKAEEAISKIVNKDGQVENFEVE